MEYGFVDDSSLGLLLCVIGMYGTYVYCMLPLSLVLRMFICSNNFGIRSNSVQTHASTVASGSFVIRYAINWKCRSLVRI